MIVKENKDKLKIMIIIKKIKKVKIKKVKKKVLIMSKCKFLIKTNKIKTLENIIVIWRIFIKMKMNKNLIIMKMMIIIMGKRDFMINKEIIMNLKNKM